MKNGEAETQNIPIETFAQAMMTEPSRNFSFNMLPENLSEASRRSLLDVLKENGATKAIESNFNVFGQVITEDDFRWFLQHDMSFVAAQAVNLRSEKRKEFQDILIEQSAWGVIATVLRSGPKFGWQTLPGLVIIPMIEAGFIREPANNLDQFGILNNEVARALVNNGHVDSVSYHLRQFEGLDQDVADAFLKLAPELIHVIGNNLDRFRNLSSGMREKLIEAGHETDVQKHPEVFQA